MYANININININPNINIFIQLLFHSLYIFQNLMEKQKSKIHEILKKMSQSSLKNYKQSPHQTPNPYSYISPSKSKPTTPLKNSINYNLSNQSQLKTNRKYAINKTTYGSPQEKSTIMSYLSTPNETSLIHSKLRKIRPNQIINCKTKQVYQSTEDENISEQTVNIQFWVGKKKLGARKFWAFQSIEQIRAVMVELLKNEKQIAPNCIGLLGLDPIPYNHGIRNFINQKSNLVNQLIIKKVNEVAIQPILVSCKPNYENIELKDFQLLKHLGSGGFSQVYLAKCELDQKLCALKFIKKDSITSAKKAKMLQNEKQILFTIDSPDLVDLLYAFETTNYIIFGLQYCENGNLYNFLQKHKRVPEGDAKYIFKQILVGLQYMHENNILFRDLKLQNILFDEKGKIKITDFGLSKPEVSEEDVTYSYCGSPEYMAPEMLAKCGHTLKVDYYALGILLYELLYGVSPFYAPKKQDIFMAIMNSEPKFPKEIEVSKEAKQLIKGLLTKEPERRIGSLKGIKQIKSHPWLRGKAVKSQILQFNFGNLKISSKEIKEIKELFRMQMGQQSSKKYFFPKSFVNRKLITDLVDNFVPLPKKKQKPEKMVKSKSRQRRNNK